MIGKMFYTSWGYDQTNYDFIIVESISPSGKTAMCKRCAYRRNDELGGMTQDAVKPVPVPFGPAFRMQIKGDYLRGSYPYLSRFEEDWDDESKKDWLKSTRLDTFMEVDESRHYYQTNPMFGH